MTKPRIVLGDDHALIVEALKAFLEPEFDVVGTALDGRELLNETERLRPDVVLLDINMPSLNGFEVARQIKQRTPEIKLLFLTQSADSAYIGAAFEAGASGYLLKQNAGPQVGEALRDALEGKTYVSPQLQFSATKHSERGKSPDQDFTSREQEILKLLAAGKSRMEMAQVMSVSLRTVDFLEARLMEKLNLSDRAQLAASAKRRG